jgi:hypothetical protein
VLKGISYNRGSSKPASVWKTSGLYIKHSRYKIFQSMEPTAFSYSAAWAELRGGLGGRWATPRFGKLHGKSTTQKKQVCVVVTKGCGFLVPSLWSRYRARKCISTFIFWFMVWSPSTWSSYTCSSSIIFWFLAWSPSTWPKHGTRKCISVIQ